MNFNQIKIIIKIVIKEMLFMGHDFQFILLFTKINCMLHNNHYIESKLLNFFPTIG